MSTFGGPLVRAAILDSFRKLDPRRMIKNPVMFVVEVGSVLTTLIWLRDLVAPRGRHARVVHRPGRALALVHGHLRKLRGGAGGGPGQGPGRRSARAAEGNPCPQADRWAREQRSASDLRKGDLVVVEAGQVIPGDGEVVEGIASVDESAVTGESAPVIRESGGDRSAVTGGTKVLSDRIVVRIGADPGHSFLDRMIGLVEGARRQKTPNEIALHVLLAGMTIISSIALITLGAHRLLSGMPFLSNFIIVACSSAWSTTPSTSLFSAIGIAGSWTS